MFKRKFRIATVLVAVVLSGNVDSQVVSTGSADGESVSGLFLTNDEMVAESTWSGISVDFRIGQDTNWDSAGSAFASKANSAIRIGIIGCGGRGTGVISSMLQHTNTNLIAMADLFQDKLQISKTILDKRNSEEGFPRVEKSNTYTGPEAYLRLLENKDVDAVLISSPAYTHSGFFETAVESTLSAIMGRDAATSSKLLTWDETYFSNTKLDPELNLSQFNR